MAIMACGVLFFGACADHYDGGESWSSPVSNATLESPKTITIEPNADGSEMTISWSVVYGAGGYEFKLFNANDETTPIVSDTLDNCKRTVSREEDMNYKVVVRALGNSELNNKEAQVAKDTTFTTFTETYAEIPEGAWERGKENGKPEQRQYETQRTSEPGGPASYAGQVYACRGRKIQNPEPKKSFPVEKQGIGHSSHLMSFQKET